MNLHRIVLFVTLGCAQMIGQINMQPLVQNEGQGRTGRARPLQGTCVVTLPEDTQTIQGPGIDSQLLLRGTPNSVLSFGIHNEFAVGIDLFTHADPGFRAPYVNFYKSRGTEVAPMPVTRTGYELDSIGGINFGGWDGEKYFTSGAAIYTQVDEDWTPTNHGAHLAIYGTSIGPSGHTQEIAHFGGKDATGTFSGNIVFNRPLAFNGNQASRVALTNSVGNPPTLHVRRADDSGDALLTALGIALSGPESFVVRTPHTPNTAFEPCAEGTITWDQNFIYVCVAANTWRRTALIAW